MKDQIDLIREEIEALEMELLEEAQDILDQVWRDEEEALDWADDIICSR